MGLGVMVSAGSGGEGRDGSEHLPLISIIVPVRNSVGTVSQCIESVLEQSFRGYELIVVDGGSTDGTVDVLRGYKLSSYHWTTGTDGGIYDAMNRGAKRAQGQWLYFLGADDILADKTVLEQVAPHLGAHPGIVLGDVDYVQGRRVRSSFSQWMLLHNTVHHQGAFYPASLMKHRPYDPDYKLLSDYDLNLEIYLSGVRATHCGVVIARCRDGGVSRTQLWRSFVETNRIRRQRLPLSKHCALMGLYAVKFALSVARRQAEDILNVVGWKHV